MPTHGKKQLTARPVSPVDPPTPGGSVMTEDMTARVMSGTRAHASGIQPAPMMLTPAMLPPPTTFALIPPQLLLLLRVLMLS